MSIIRIAACATTASLFFLAAPVFVVASTSRSEAQPPSPCAIANGACSVLGKYVDDKMSYHTYVCTLVNRSGNQFLQAAAMQMIADRWYGGDVYSGEDAYYSEAC